MNLIQKYVQMIMEVLEYYQQTNCNNSIQSMEQYIGKQNNQLPQKTQILAQETHQGKQRQEKILKSILINQPTINNPKQGIHYPQRRRKNINNILQIRDIIHKPYLFHHQFNYTQNQEFNRKKNKYNKYQSYRINPTFNFKSNQFNHNILQQQLQCQSLNCLDSNDRLNHKIILHSNPTHSGRSKTIGTRLKIVYLGKKIQNFRPGYQSVNKATKGKLPKQNKNDENDPHIRTPMKKQNRRNLKGYASRLIRLRKNHQQQQRIFSRYHKTQNNLNEVYQNIKQLKNLLENQYQNNQSTQLDYKPFN